MDWDHGAGTVGQRPTQRVRIHEQMIVIYVDEHRPRTRTDHGLGGSHEGIHRDDDLVSAGTGTVRSTHHGARTDTGRPQRQLDRVSAVAHTHAVPDLAEVGILALECRNVLSTDKRGGREHFVEPGPHLLGDLGLRSRQIHQRNRGHRNVPSMG